MKKLNTSVVQSQKNNESDVQECVLRIAVGVTNDRSRLRISVLLNTISEYKVRYITPNCEIADAIEESDLVIGSGIMACEGILHRKPVIVVGGYGSGGLVTPDTLHSQCNNRFKGRVSGMKDEYFPLAELERDITRSTNLTFQELQMMSNQMVTLLDRIDF